MAITPKLLFANNIALSNVSLVDQDTTNNTYDLQFDISWENSWRTAITPSATDNWDAAWVFAKYSTYSGGSWSAWAHCTVSSAGAQTPAMDFADNKGVFIYRPDVTTTGSNNWDNVEIRWSYGTAFADDAIVKVKVFAIEMVYIPQGSFYVGDTDNDNTNSFFTADSSYAEDESLGTYQITSEDPITVGTALGNLYYDNDNDDPDNDGSPNYAGDGAGPIPAAFPKGFAAFYIMKYEISQGQYADFLNTLTATQDGNRSIQGETDYTTYRGTISGSQGSRTASAPERACNFLKWADIAAYADWAALRPFTELEFEKAARGGQAAVDDEYAWGSGLIATSVYTLSNSGANNEGIATNYSTTSGNASYSTTDGSINGPLRCGIFAANASNTGRITAGASYYGVMELSGNLWERPVTIGNSTGRNFDGANGDGALSTNGNANETSLQYWPGYSGGEITTSATGSGFRGGIWDNGSSFARVSDRHYAASTNANRYYYYGGRLARTSP